MRLDRDSRLFRDQTTELAVREMSDLAGCRAGIDPLTIAAAARVPARASFEASADGMGIRWGQRLTESAAGAVGPLDSCRAMTLATPTCVAFG
jgi:hypothetical protein